MVSDQALQKHCHGAQSLVKRAAHSDYPGAALIDLGIPVGGYTPHQKADKKKSSAKQNWRGKRPRVES